MKKYLEQYENELEKERQRKKNDSRKRAKIRKKLITNKDLMLEILLQKN